MRSRKLWWTVLGLLLVAGGALTVHAFRQRVVVGGGATGQRVPLEAFDHAAFDALLQKHVDDKGLVAYARWKADGAAAGALDDYLAALGNVDLQAPASKPARLAYWINAYNALTIKAILMKYPTASIQDQVSYLPGGYNVWRDLLLPIDGTKVSLDDMEHKILRKMDQPLIHFGLVCASRGCPPLRNRAYTPAKVEEELGDNARRFFASPANCRPDQADVTIHLTQLLDWYGADFAVSRVDRARVLRPYFPSPDKLAWLDDAGLSVEFDLKYDWALNDQQAAKN